MKATRLRIRNMPAKMKQMPLIQIVAANTLNVSCFQGSNLVDVSELAIACYLLTLEPPRTVCATKEWDSTTYFLSDIEEQPE